jgi:hypothetical protein
MPFLSFTGFRPRLSPCVRQAVSPALPEKQKGAPFTAPLCAAPYIQILLYSAQKINGGRPAGPKISGVLKTRFFCKARIRRAGKQKTHPGFRRAAARKRRPRKAIFAHSLFRFP